MAELNCATGGENTGVPCVPIIRALEKFIFVPTYNSLGVANEIDLTGGPFNAAYFSALVNNTDATERWFVLPQFKNVVNTRAESLMETFEDGSKVFIEQGIRNITGLIVGSDAPPQLKGKIVSHRGNQMSIYGIDKAGNLIGKVGSTADMLAPIELEGDTIDAIFQYTNDTTIQKIAVMFDINISEDDSQVRMLAASEMATSIKNLRGLYDVTSVNSAISTTGLTVTLKTEGGTLLNPVMVEGLLITDFVSSVGGATSRLYNSTDAANVTISTLAESAPGVYDLTFAGQTVSDVIVIKPLKAGFDFTAVEANTATIV